MQKSDAGDTPKNDLQKQFLFAATYFREILPFSGSLYTNIRTPKHTIPYNSDTLNH
jgi:hypothetical protein